MNTRVRLCLLDDVHLPRPRCPALCRSFAGKAKTRRDADMAAVISEVVLNAWGGAMRGFYSR